MSIEAHFSMLGTDEDKPVEDLIRTLCGVIGYSLMTLRLRPQDAPKIHRHMASELDRVRRKLDA